MIKLLASLVMALSLNAQAPLVPGAWFPIGRNEWVTVCASYSVATEITCAPVDAIIDPGYGYPNSLAIKVGSTFYVRATQHPLFDCTSWISGNGTWPALFIMGPKDNAFIPIPLTFGVAGQNYLFCGSGQVWGSTHYGQHELKFADCWAVALQVPNNPSFSGLVWEAQAAMLAATLTGPIKVHLGTSRYVRMF